MKWVRYSIKRVTKKWMRIAKRKCIRWVRRYIRTCGFKLRTFKRSKAIKMCKRMRKISFGFVYKHHRR